MVDHADYGLVSIVNMFLLKHFDEILRKTSMVFKLIPGEFNPSEHFRILLQEEKDIDEFNLSLKFGILNNGGYVINMSVHDFKLNAVLTDEDFSIQQESQTFKLGIIDNPRITKVRQKGSKRVKYIFKSTLYDLEEGLGVMERWNNVFTFNKPFYKMEYVFTEECWTVIAVNVIEGYQVNILSLHSLPEKDSLIYTEQNLFF